MIGRRALHRHDRTRGQALVEFALILPIFILLLVGILDFGRAVYGYNTVNNAAHEAVRVGIVDQNATAITARATKHAVALGLAASDITVKFLQSDYTGDGITNDCAPGQVLPLGPRLGCIVEVSVTYQYTAATPIIGNLVGTLTLTGKSQQPIERTYQSP
ncbi:MAG: TadE/TadG family type IV pilus assembly protein [Candidatus Limnocylindria bacterium]